MNTWYAFNAANSISFDWADAAHPATTAEHFLQVEGAFAGKQDSQFRDDGDVEEALAEATIIAGEYRVPYLAHATMEPLNAVADLHDGRLDIWAGNQAPTQVVKDGAAIASVEEDAVHVHTTYMGGGFGRRAEMDFIKSAVHLATAMPGPDISIVQAAWDQPYGIPNYRVTGYRAPALLPVSSWRSVGASQNGFFHESIMDELAHAAGIDPLEMRLSLLTNDASRKVLEAVAEMSNWGSQLPPGHGRGVAFVLAFGVPTAEVIEVADTDSGIRITKAFAAVDVGVALDPRNIEAQVQSGLNFGIAAAMMGEITVTDGMVQQQNFDSFDSIRMRQAPSIKVRILENGAKIRGIGEPGTPPAAPALANAIFAATGQRVRELPLEKHIRFA